MTTITTKTTRKPAAPSKAVKTAPKAVESKAAKPAPAPRQRQNGVVLPNATGVSGRLWTEFDRLGEGATAEQAKAFAEANGLNATTAKLALGYWRKYHGIAAPAPVAKPKATPAPVAKKAAKAKAAAKPKADDLPPGSVYAATA